VMMHMSMKFHEMFFIGLQVVVPTRKKAYLTSIHDLDSRKL